MEYNGTYTPVMYKLYNNSLHKTSMMYRILYTKLSYSLLSQLLDILRMRSINMIYCALRRQRCNQLDLLYVDTQQK